MELLEWALIAAAAGIAAFFIVPSLIFLYAKAARYGALKAEELSKQNQQKKEQ